MRHTRKKFSVYSASPGLENTEKYGTRKYSSKKKKELDKLYREFLNLHSSRKSRRNRSNRIKGKRRTWTVN
tara:strand:+ start:174 stop:386 length:213 start_codon:yes stop_codon:yes gene_type:complete